MSGEDADIDMQPDTMEGIASLLLLGTVSLDGLALTAPPLPDAGGSTPVVADGIATVAESVAALAAALGATGENVDATIRDTVATEGNNTADLDGIDVEPR